MNISRILRCAFLILTIFIVNITDTNAQFLDKLKKRVDQAEKVLDGKGSSLRKDQIANGLKEALDMKNAHNTNIIAFNFSGKGTFLQSDIVESEQIIISGPESGFSDDELELLNSHNVNIRLLGKNILRAETAAIVGATLLQNYLGEL